MNFAINLPYRPCVGIMLLNDKNEVFVGQRIDTELGVWQMPQGGIDKGESPKEAALRELFEEAGTDKVKILQESKDWLKYDLPAELLGKVWYGKYRGQRQKWFAMRFLGNNSDINIATEHPEFCDWKWVAPQTLPNIIIPFKRTLYEELLIEFADVLQFQGSEESSNP